jgi:hypothetical protein
MKSRRSLSRKRRAISQLQQGIMRLARCCSLRGGRDVTNQALPGRPPAHDLSAFDLSKRSPAQVAQSFARWKSQRKRQAEAGPARADPLPSPKPAVAETGEAAPVETKRPSAKQASAPQYSASFSDLLAAGSEPTVQRTWPPVTAVRPPQRTSSPGRRLKVMSILAGAASVFALAGGALLELSDWRDPAAMAPQMAHVRPMETPMALAAVATSLPAGEWTLQHTVDVALMKAAPDTVRSTPEASPAAIQTASKTVPIAGDKPVILPERESATPEAAEFVAKPYVPNVAPTPVRMPAAQAAAPIPAPPVAAAIHAGDPRPDDLFQHGRDHRNGTVSNRTANDRTVNDRGASSGRPAAATGTGSAVDSRSASARSGTAASGSSTDPRGEGSGGARVGIGGEVGTPSDASAGGVSGGKGGAGDAGDGSSDGGANGGGSSAGAADGGDAAGAGAGDGGTGDTGAGGGDTGGESGDASEGGSGDGDSDAGEDGGLGGIGGAVGGALGAVGDALGGALGGGKGNPDRNDKDQRN